MNAARQNDGVLAVSAVIGFGIGAILVPTWQDAVETGQVLAGVVQYPDSNPLYGYHVRVWTIVCQAAGLLLALGMSEHAASVLVSGLMGALAFSGLAQVAWALSKNWVLALASPCLAFAAYQTADQYGVVYPIFAFGNRSTHGIVALSSATLLLGLWGAERHRGAALLMGLLPAVHPIMAAWCWGALMPVGLLRREMVRAELGRCLPWFLGGFTVTLVSFVLQMWIARHVPEVSAEVQEQFRAAYTENWDLHRKPADWLAPGMFIVYAMTGLLSVAYWKDASRRTTTGILLSASVLGFVFAGLSWMTGYLPSIVGAIMPARFVNPIIFASSAIMIGVLGRYAGERWAHVLLVAHVGFIALTRIFPGAHVAFRWEWHCVEMVAISVGTAVCLAKSKPTETEGMTRRMAVVIAMATILALGASTGRLVRKGIDPPMFGRQNDLLMSVISDGEGVLATASNIGQIQIRARRAVLLNGAAIDYLPYFPETGPEMNRILTELYGVDLLGDPPPPDADYARYLEETYGPEYMSMRDEIPELNPGQLPTETGRDLWESWSPAEWREKAGELGFTQVLAYAEWNIDLPEVARDGEFALYDVPHE